MTPRTWAPPGRRRRRSWRHRPRTLRRTRACSRATGRIHGDQGDQRGHRHADRHRLDNEDVLPVVDSRERLWCEDREDDGHGDEQDHRDVASRASRRRTVGFGSGHVRLPRATQPTWISSTCTSSSLHSRETPLGQGLRIEAWTRQVGGGDRSITEHEDAAAIRDELFVLAAEQDHADASLCSSLDSVEYEAPGGRVHARGRVVQVGRTVAAAAICQGPPSAGCRH